MKHASGLGYWVRVVGLPLLLVLLTATLLGSHYETNDDFSITLLLRGRAAAAPITNLHLYFHGWAGLLAWLYQLWPAAPWYGLVLYALLTLALVLLTAVLEKLLTPHASPAQRAGLLTLFLFLAGLEHAQWFNYVRVPLLLGGAALLWTAQQPARRPGLRAVGLLLFVAAWAIRPSAAVLGAVAVAPVAWALGGRSGGRVVGGVGTVALLLGLLVQLTRSPEAARYRRLDVLKSEVLDFGWRVPAPRTAADRRGVQAVAQWSFGDSTLVNEAFFERAYRPNPHLVAQRLAGLGPGAVQLGRDYFPLLALHALLLALGLSPPALARRWAGLYLLGVLLLLLGLHLGLKLPPRLAGPLLTLSLVAHAALLSPLQLALTGFRRYALYGLLGALVLAYGAKAAHRRGVLDREARANLGFMRILWAQSAGSPFAPAPKPAPQVLVGSGLETRFKSLSPFGQYVPPGSPPWLLLTGWLTLDPSQARLRAQLTGTRDQSEALRRLARRPNVQWVGPAPERLR